MAKFFTKDFQQFVNCVPDINFYEIYDLYQISTGNDEGQTTFTSDKAYGSSDDIIIGYEPTEGYLRLSPKAASYFPEWIIENLMDGLDAESFWGLKNAIDKND